MEESKETFSKIVKQREKKILESQAENYIMLSKQ